MANLISQLCNKLQPAVCLSRGAGAIWRLPKQLWMTNKAQKQATANATWATFSIQYLSELLVNVHSYYLMVKSMFYCYVHGRWIFSNLVTIFIVSSHNSHWDFKQTYKVGYICCKCGIFLLAKLLRFSWFSRVPLKFLCKYKNRSLKVNWSGENFL